MAQLRAVFGSRGTACCAPTPRALAAGWIRGSFFFTFLIVVSAVVVLAQQAAAPADVRVSSTVDKSSVTVGDVIRYALTIEWAKGVQVTPPSLGVNLGQFEIRDYKAGEPKAIEGGRTRLVSTYDVAIYEAGSFTVPGVPVKYKDAAGVERTIDSEAVNVLVASANPDMKGTIRDVKAPVAIPIRWRPYILVGSGVLAALVLTIGGYLYYRAWRARRARLAEEARVPAHEWALQRIEELRAAGHIEAGRVKEHYAGLSEILRGYLERRYGVPALERTTDELSEETRRTPLAPGSRDGLLAFLEACDLVKFAKHVPGAEVHPRMLEQAREFVRATALGAAPAAPPEPPPAPIVPPPAPAAEVAG